MTLFANNWLILTNFTKLKNGFFFSDISKLIYCHMPAWRVSNEPPGQRQDTGPGILWSVHRWTRPRQKLKKERTAHLIRLIFTKTGWAWHVTIYFNNIMYSLKSSGFLHRKKYSSEFETKITTNYKPFLSHCQGWLHSEK